MSGRSSAAAPPPESDAPLIVVTPDVARPGEVIELRYPTELSRGVPFFMSRWENDQWSEPQFLLISDQGHMRVVGPGWHPRGSAWGWRNIGIGGHGPDRLKVPDVTEPGLYRICTANAVGGPYCVQLAVSA
jgi:hypothetical protein